MKFTSPLFVPLISFAITSKLSAAVISWSPPAELISVADVIQGTLSTTGVNGGYNVVTINGVTYQRFNGPNFGQITSQPTAITATGQNNAIYGFSQAGADVYSVPTGNMALDTLLATHIYDGSSDNATGSISIQLNSLTVGAIYRVQLIGMADTRTSPSNFPLRSTTPDGGTTLLRRSSDLNNDGTARVNFSVGTFVADATTQNITIEGRGTGSGGGFSGVIIAQDTIPEPSSALLIGLSGAFLFLRRRVA